MSPSPATASIRSSPSPIDIPEVSPDNVETVAVFSAPLAAFIPPSPIEVTTAERDGYRLRYGGYRIGQYHVWGATAGILGRLGVYLAQGDET